MRKGLHFGGSSSVLGNYGALQVAKSLTKFLIGNDCVLRCIQVTRGGILPPSNGIRPSFMSLTSKRRVALLRYGPSSSSLSAIVKSATIMPNRKLSFLFFGF
jgi:hypothetical protein